jgi:hypothetical protein
MQQIEENMQQTFKANMQRPEDEKHHVEMDFG